MIGKDELLAELARLGIEATTVSHPPLFTVADSQRLRGELPGGHTKNLFLRDRKDRHFLLVVDENAVVDLKTVHTVIGASGKVSFGKPETLLDYLGVVPGAVTVFGAINDTGKRVTILLDEALMENAVINAHPLVNDATTAIQRDDLRRFLEATGHGVNVLKIAG